MATSTLSVAQTSISSTLKIYGLSSPYPTLSTEFTVPSSLAISLSTGINTIIPISGVVVLVSVAENTTVVVTGTQSSSTAQTSASNTNSSSSSNLTSGAKAGIGIGVALAVIIVAGTMLFILIRKRRMSSAPVDGGLDQTTWTKAELEDIQKTQKATEITPGRSHSELDGIPVAELGSHTPAELPGT